MRSYEAQTLRSPNPFARYAHRHRLRRSVGLALSMLDGGRLLDYGCGSGAFVAAVDALRPGCVVGYEPFMAERAADNLPIHPTLEAVEAQGPYSLVTLFESLEHLSNDEIDEFLGVCERTLSPQGGILLSAPIEMGPVLLLKETNRMLFGARKSEYGAVEFLKAAVLAVPGRRADDIKTSHRGFDFRRAMEYLREKGWSSEVLGYGPLPVGIWYGNSQVFWRSSALSAEH